MPLSKQELPFQTRMKDSREIGQMGASIGTIVGFFGACCMALDYSTNIMQTERDAFAAFIGSALVIASLSIVESAVNENRMR